MRNATMRQFGFTVCYLRPKAAFKNLPGLPQRRRIQGPGRQRHLFDFFE